MVHGVFAAVEHNPVLIGRFLTLVDIGANRGQFSLAFRALNPKAKIYAFEPLPVPAVKFCTVFSGDQNVSMHQVAIGCADATMNIHVSQRDDSSSLLEIGRLQTENFPGTGESHTMEVQVLALSNILQASSITPKTLLKIDVQGFELNVLRGCGELLPLFDAIYCECSFLPLYSAQALAPEVIEYLAQAGFALCGVYNMAYDSAGLSIQADFLFEKRKYLTKN